MSYSAVGQVFDIPSFRDHVKGLNLAWADSVCLHHTALPNLSMRPSGWTIQHMRNLAAYYGGQLGWSAGPHFFTDENEVFGLSPATEPGTHAVSFNRRSIGIEALGDYDVENPIDGRGKLVWETTCAATAILLDKLGLPATERTVLFHRDDPKTSKTCPGKLVSKTEIVAQIARELAEIHSVRDQEDKPAEPPSDLSETILTRINNIQWQIDQLKKEIGA